MEGAHAHADGGAADALLWFVCVDRWYVPVRQYSARCSLERSGRMVGEDARVVVGGVDGDVAFEELL